MLGRSFANVKLAALCEMDQLPSAARCGAKLLRWTSVRA